MNDRMNDDERKSLNPLIIKMINTRSEAHEELRVAHLLRGLAREILPIVFDLRKLPEISAILRAIPEDATRAQMVNPLQDVKKRADAAFDAAFDTPFGDASAPVFGDAFADAFATAFATTFATAAAFKAADAVDAAAYGDARKRIMEVAVQLLSEAIELGPHNGQEFYDMPAMTERIQAFQQAALIAAK